MSLRAGAVAGTILLASCASVPKAPQIHPMAPRAPVTVPAAIMLEGTAAQGGILFGTAPAGTRRLSLDGQDVGIAPDGRFVIGLGRDAGPNATLRVEMAGGREVTRAIVVAPRSWQIETLATLPRRPMPSAEYEVIRSAEVAKINAARAIVTDAAGWRQTFVWPVVGRISGVFGSQRIYKGGEKGEYHSGVDIAGATGTPVIAPADGVVILAADKAYSLEGNLLMIDHGMGLNSAFLHLSQIDVKPGEHVARGQRIGAVGATGRATGPHLHWGLMLRGVRVDPAGLVGPRAAQ